METAEIESEIHNLEEYNKVISNRAKIMCDILEIIFKDRIKRIPDEYVFKIKNEYGVFLIDIETTIVYYKGLRICIIPPRSNYFLSLGNFDQFISADFNIKNDWLLRYLISSVYYLLEGYKKDNINFYHNFNAHSLYFQVKEINHKLKQLTEKTKYIY